MSRSPEGTAGVVVGVFGGGGAKAAAHVGAFRALEEAGLVPGHFLGTSMGAVFAAMFACGLSAREVLERIGEAGGRMVRGERFAVFKGLWARSLLQPAPFRAALERLVPVRRFEDLRYPLTVTATALDNGELVLFGSGGRPAPLIEALYASCALPLFFPPAVIDGRRLADGGLRAVLPLEPAALVPCRMVVAVDTGPALGEPVEGGGSRGLPPVVIAHSEATAILMGGQTAQALALWRAAAARPPLVYIRPEVPQSGSFQVDQVRRFVEQGYVGARATLAGLKSGSP